MFQLNKYLFPLYLLVASALCYAFMQDDSYKGRESVTDALSAPRITISSDKVLTLSSLERSDAIFYTLDGSQPSIESERYHQGVKLYGRDLNRELYIHKSSVAQKIGFVDDFPIQAFVVKAASANKRRGLSKSNFKTILTKNKSRQLKILSLGIDPSFFFDEWSGKSSFGRDFWTQKELMINKRWWDWSANYKDDGFSSSSIGSFELLTKEGESLVSDNVRVRIHGNASRSFPQKSFRIEADHYYGSEFITNVFETASKSFLVRNSGNDRGLSQFADAFMQEVSQGLNVIVQQSEPVHLLINGCYWGVYNLRDRFDLHYLEQVDPQTDGRIAVISGDHKLKAGKTKDLTKYMHIEEELKSSKSIEEKALFLKEHVDLKSFMDYIIVESYFANSDWPHNNLKCFRQGKNGKWRWLIYDLDYGMSYVGSKAYQFNVFEKLKKHKGTTGEIFRHILRDENLKSDFIKRFKQVLKNDFNHEVLSSKLDAFKSKYNKDIEYQIERWRKPNSIAQWESYIEGFRDFISKRQDVILSQLSAL